IEIEMNSSRFYTQDSRASSFYHFVSFSKVKEMICLWIKNLGMINTMYGLWMHGNVSLLGKPNFFKREIGITLVLILSSLFVYEKYKQDRLKQQSTTTPVAPYIVIVMIGGGLDPSVTRFTHN
ncbi:hypothetical protein ACJX0J_020336, partial [Zea mays]